MFDLTFFLNVRAEQVKLSKSQTYRFSSNYLIRQPWTTIAIPSHNKEDVVRKST